MVELSQQGEWFKISTDNTNITVIAETILFEKYKEKKRDGPHLAKSKCEWILYLSFLLNGSWA